MKAHQQNKKIYSRLLCTFLLSCLVSFLLAPTALAATFRDLQGHWSAGDVQTLIDHGAIGGYPDGTFRPDSTITRAEFSKILRQSLALSTVSGNDFTDTTKHWAAADIHTLVSHQIIVPAEYGQHYQPDSAITRREMAIMLVRAMGLNDTATALSGQATSFSDDSQIASYDKGYLYLAKDLGLIGGYEDGSFRPSGKATRAEASVMIVRLLQLRSNSQTQPETPAVTTPVQPEISAPNKTDANTQTIGQVHYQLALQQTERTAVNAAGEQYLIATLQLTINNQSAQSITVSEKQLRTIVTYSNGAMVTAMQSDFTQTIPAGQQKTVTATVSILLPNNTVAQMVLGNAITNIALQVSNGTETLPFSNVSQALLNTCA